MGTACHTNFVLENVLDGENHHTQGGEIWRQHLSCVRRNDA